MCVEVKLKLISNSIHLNKYGLVCLAPRRSDGASVRTPAPVRLLHVGTRARTVSRAPHRGTRYSVSHAPHRGPRALRVLRHSVSRARTVVPLRTHAHAGEPSSCSSWLL